MSLSIATLTTRAGQAAAKFREILAHDPDVRADLRDVAVQLQIPELLDPLILVAQSQTVPPGVDAEGSLLQLEAKLEALEAAVHIAVEIPGLTLQEAFLRVIQEREERVRAAFQSEVLRVGVGLGMALAIGVTLRLLFG